MNSEVVVTATDLLERTDEFFRRAPAVDGLRITEGAGLLEAVAQLPHLARLTTLDLRWNRLLPGEARALAQSPHLTGLRRLVMHDCALGDEGLREFALSSSLVRLSEWLLTDNGLSNDGLATLADSTRFPELSSLSFGHYSVRPYRYDAITRKGLLLLAASFVLPSLTTIHWYELTDRRDVPYEQISEELLAVCRAVRLVTHVEQIW